MPVEAEAAQTSPAEGQQRCPDRRAEWSWSWSWMDAPDVELATEIGVCAEEGVGCGGRRGSTGDGFERESGETGAGAGRQDGGLGRRREGGSGGRGDWAATGGGRIR
uniref:DUF834 domain-containing protein n=1 Tax=Oryza glumipatula TaxID=40148 RepID=A0A0D9YC30_9ORYZ